MSRSKKYLNIALLLIALNAAVFGQLYVNAPSSYFGAANEFTRFGVGFALLGFLFVSAAVVGLLRNRERALSFGITAVAGFLIAFVPALVDDPVNASIVIAWQAYILARIQMREDDTSKALINPPPDADTVLAHRNSALFAILLSIAIDGYQLTNHAFGLAICAFAHFVAVAFFWPTFWKTRKESPHLFYFLIGAIAFCATLVGYPRLFLGFAAAFQVISLYASGRGSPIFLGVFTHFMRVPALFVAMSFVALILVGAMFLSFPSSVVGGVISPVDALFTAVSAACVTGLSVLDTASQFTSFGQVVILVLIQLGGLGIMTLSTVAARIVVGNVGLLAESTFGNLLDVRGPRSIYKLIRVMLISTVAIESVGAAILTSRFRAQGLPWDEALWKGVFHSVSAFCNAGFALQSNSLEGFATDYTLLFTIMALIIVGGIGFPTMVMCADYMRSKQRTKFPLQVRIIVWSSLVLCLAGWAGFTALEWNGVLRNFGVIDKLVNGLFQSVTLRTAGFNSVPLNSIHSATVAFVILFMFIGGAPGSTAGGIKVTTATLLLAAVRAFGHGEGTVTIGGRRVPPSTMYRAISVLVVALVLVLALHLSLLLTQPQRFEALAFEAVSAVGTVGLSMGVTTELESAGKFLVMLGMYAGRVGPLTLTLAIAGKSRRKFKLAEEPVMVG